LLTSWNKVEMEPDIGQLAGAFGADEIEGNVRTEALPGKVDK
jgi:hypothetical protein